MKPRTPEGEARRLEALKSAESRAKMSTAKKGKTPKNFSEAQQKGWEASRKETLTYSGIHAWVRRNWGKAHHCELCGKDNLSGRAVHWANKDHLYTRNRDDWKMMCRSCHAEHDSSVLGVSFTKHDLTTSAETRAKRAAALKGRKRDPEVVARVTAANRGQKRSPEQREVMASAHKGKPWSEARRAAQEKRKEEQPFPR